MAYAPKLVGGGKPRAIHSNFDLPRGEPLRHPALYSPAGGEPFLRLNSPQVLHPNTTRLKRKRQKPLLLGLDAIKKLKHGRVGGRGDICEVSVDRMDSRLRSRPSAHRDPRLAATAALGELYRAASHPAARKRIRRAQSPVQAPTSCALTSDIVYHSQRLLPEVCCARARRSNLRN